LKGQERGHQHKIYEAHTIKRKMLLVNEHYIAE